MVDRIRAREADIARFISRLDKFLFRNLDNILGDIESGSIEGMEAARVLGSLQSSLRQLGLNKELAELQTIYATELSQIRREFKDFDLKGRDLFTDLDKDVIEELIKFDTDKTATNINKYVDNVRSVVMQSVIVGDTPDFADVHDKFGGALEHNLDAELNTSLAAFDRTVTIKKATDLGLELFLYTGPGPDDKKIRDFCKHVLEERDPPIYTIDEIKHMDNDTGLDVLTYGGGYNCRHRWRPVSYDFAIELGYKAPN